MKQLLAWQTWTMALLVFGFALICASTVNARLVPSPRPQPGHAATELPPYGGCDESWQAPASAGAAWCTAHGR